MSPTMQNSQQTEATANAEAPSTADPTQAEQPITVSTTVDTTTQQSTNVTFDLGDVVETLAPTTSLIMGLFSSPSDTPEPHAVFRAEAEPEVEPATAPDTESQSLTTYFLQGLSNFMSNLDSLDSLGATVFTESGWNSIKSFGQTTWDFVCEISKQVLTLVEETVEESVTSVFDELDEIFNVTPTSELSLLLEEAALCAFQRYEGIEIPHLKSKTRAMILLELKAASEQYKEFIETLIQLAADAREERKDDELDDRTVQVEEHEDQATIVATLDPRLADNPELEAYTTEVYIETVPTAVLLDRAVSEEEV